MYNYKLQHNGYLQSRLSTKKINEEITVPKHTWKVKPNGTPIVQIKKKRNHNYIEYVYKHVKCEIWEYYFLHNASIIILSSCGVKELCVTHISSLTP